MNNLKEFNDYIDLCLSEYDAENYQDIYEFASEAADSSEYAIYTAKAWSLVNMIREADYDLFDQAETELDDLGTELDNLNQTMSLMAYMVILNAIINKFNQTEA
jgi:hypothetical protein